MEFWEWIEGKFVQWRGPTRATVQEYADYLGVSQSLLSQWMKKKGKVPRGKKQIDALVSKYPDDKQLYEFFKNDLENDPFFSLPSDLRKRAITAFEEVGRAIKERGVPLDSEEAEKISNEIMSRFGFISIDKK